MARHSYVSRSSARWDETADHVACAEGSKKFKGSKLKTLLEREDNIIPSSVIIHPCVGNRLATFVRDESKVTAIGYIYTHICCVCAFCCFCFLFTTLHKSKVTTSNVGTGSFRSGLERAEKKDSQPRSFLRHLFRAMFVSSCCKDETLVASTTDCGRLL